MSIWDEVNDWVYAKLKLKKKDQQRGLWCRVKVRDLPGGKFRLSLPPHVMITLQITPDGQYLASSLEDGGIALWDVNPIPRWQKAVVAGVASFGLFVLLGRRRRGAVYR